MKHYMHILVFRYLEIYVYERGEDGEIARMKRIGIFCIYAPTGKIDSAIMNTLRELRDCVTYLIVVINGDINKRNDISAYANGVVIRKNIGLDVGAYTDVMLSSTYMDKIKDSDELVLCNSSFYGPFISFKMIFSEMDNSPADFWGISSSEKNFVEHIQSYFIVFRNKVLKGKELFLYLEERVDSEKIDYFDACSIFENGLFWNLKDAGYRFDAYRRNIECDNYLNPYGSVKIDRIPILKKKIFSPEFYEKRKAMNALAYIKDIYHYDIDSILDSVHSEYGIHMAVEELENGLEEAQKDIYQDHELIDREDVEMFIKSHEKIFIYGNGIMAKMVYSCFFFYEKNSKLEGFIVSDNQDILEQNFKGYPIYHYSEIKDRSKLAILVALNKHNTKEVISQFKEKGTIKFLWKEFV